MLNLVHRFENSSGFTLYFSFVMSVYLVSYDLRTPGKEYAPLHACLKSYPAHAKPLESVWLIGTSLSAEQLREAVCSHMDANDRLLVLNIAAFEVAWLNLLPGADAWIKSLS
jgi:hypothetical protein